MGPYLMTRSAVWTGVTNVECKLGVNNPVCL